MLMTTRIQNILPVLNTHHHLNPVTALAMVHHQAAVMDPVVPAIVLPVLAVPAMTLHLEVLLHPVHPLEEKLKRL